MRYPVLALSTLVFLAGCPEEILPADPPVQSARPIRLEAGAYGVLVTDVNELDCEGMRREDLFGMQLPLDLRFERGGVAFGYLADLYVEGAQRAGELNLAAVAPPVIAEDDDEPKPAPGEDEEADSDASTEDTEADGADAGEGRDCADSRGGCDDDGEEGDDEGDEGDDDVVVIEEPEDFEFALSLVASRRDHADGRLYYSFQGCSLELVVVAQKLEGGDDPRPVPAEETEPGTEVEPVGEECDDEEADCG